MWNFSAHFIARPVATTLLMLGLVLAGAIAFTRLPVAPLPQVDYPTISVSASLPGASPETMAATVATPLERQLGRISGVSEITSSSSLGSTRVVLQFDLNRNINDAAIEVQAAINAARGQLPSGMPNNPTARKVNPADAPIMVLALVSDLHTRAQLYDVASTILAQKLSQVRGIGQVNVGGGALPAVRVAVNPRALNHQGIGLEQVRAALVAANSNRPKGLVEEGDRQWWIYANDQAFTAAEYLPLLVSYRNGAAVRLADVASVTDSVQDKNNAAVSDGKPAVLLILYREPNANILATVQRIQDLLPWLQASMPAAMELSTAMERTATIRASIREVERTLIIAVGLVVLVVFAFLRNMRATFIPAAAVPVSLIGTFAFMYLAGYSVNNLSLMALIVAAGFVVDDAIVVLENTSRYIERGYAPHQAALLGAREVGFTVLSMSVSLVAVFIPILLMGDIVGRLFREFAVTLSVSILISLVVSLTLTPMMCAKLLRAPQPQRGLVRASERFFNALLRGYERSLAFALRHSLLTILILAAVIGLNVHLYNTIPKGFFPQQDTGRLFGGLRADQSAPFELTRQKMERFVEIVRADPAVQTVTAVVGGGSRRSGTMFVTLKPLAERKESAQEVVARLRRQVLRVPGARLFLGPVQDVRIGGRQASSTYQYTLRSDDLQLLRTWTPRLEQALQGAPELVDIDSDQETRGLQLSLMIDRATASRYGITPDLIDATLGNAFSQAVVSTIYRERNQYRVVLEVEEAFARSPEALKRVYVRAPNGNQIPLSAVANYEYTNTPLSVNHQSQFAAATISFDLAEGASLSDATARIQDTATKIGMPNTVFGSFEGTARGFQRSIQYQPFLILAAIVAVYIVLGILYESYIHPLTILSTLPSAGVGALLGLMLFEEEFGIIALIALFLLIGIVKKNAIMMVDFALAAERREGKPPEEAIFEACRLRFRPIMMTTLAAMLGALPLALGAGDGAELRRPLGIAIVGGLLLSQLLTLYTTPVVYLYLDRFRLWCRRLRRPGAPIAEPELQ
ncbi:MAG: multidrug efflux RND transporter permease subunit [Betaproteobacteria bacterium]|nr:MAG: multidrug efflux RND transporter permease subunit [Betaproteobacteria bacterium]